MISPIEEMVRRAQLVAHATMVYKETVAAIKGAGLNVAPGLSIEDWAAHEVWLLCQNNHNPVSITKGQDGEWTFS